MNIAPSAPTETIVLWSGLIVIYPYFVKLTFVIVPEWPSPTKYHSLLQNELRTAFFGVWASQRLTLYRRERALAVMALDCVHHV